MKFNDKGKLVEIKRTTFEDLEYIYSQSSCIANFIELISKEYNLSRDISYNVAMAVIHKYKYLKVVD